MNAAARALGERAQAMIDAIAEISDEPGRLTRPYLGPAHRRAIDLVTEWMKRAGLAVRIDSAATVHGLRPAEGSLGRRSRRLLVGSHIDTVVDAGRYDGTLGVVAGILAAEEIAARGIPLPFGLEVLAFGDEEGSRFPATMLGSSALAGTIAAEALDAADADGISVRQALADFGCDPAAIDREAYRRDDVVGYLEVHIEQGPVLDRAGEPLAMVTAICGQTRARVVVRGEPGHAGTVPMNARRDALAAAADAIVAIEAIARRSDDPSLVATVGTIKADPGAPNVIAGGATFSLDVRAADDAARLGAVALMRAKLGEIARSRGVTIEMETVHDKPSVSTALRLNQAIAAAIAGLTGNPPRRVASGAGHDGQALAPVAGIGMIFVRCRGGVSHSPAEFASVDDIGLAVEALIRTILGLAAKEG